MAKERIHKIISRAGLLSRRKAEEAILQGRVQLNGQIVEELGTVADPETDCLELDKKRVVPRRNTRVILLNKPRMVVTTKSDPEGRKTVMDLLPAEYSNLNPVGRLDFGTEGLLLLTDDGELLNHLTHPRYEVEKEYLALVQGRPSASILTKLMTKVDLEDGPGKFDRVVINHPDRSRPPISRPDSAVKADTFLRIVVSEGRNRFVRRMLESIGHPVLRLTRTRQGSLKLDGLQPGAFRLLTEEELLELRKIAKL